MSNLKKGSELNKIAQAAALAKFIHRYTMDHAPRWVRDSEVAYPVQFYSDLDWLANTEFHVRADGYLDERYNHCYSTPTWPNKIKETENE